MPRKKYVCSLNVIKNHNIKADIVDFPCLDGQFAIICRIDEPTSDNDNKIGFWMQWKIGIVKFVKKCLKNGKCLPIA
jgi:hypothetical protein